jgi:hypothetical protein
MLWNDPWIFAATDRSQSGTFCTTLPPPRPTLPLYLQFQCIPATSMSDMETWLRFVKTGWKEETARQRLQEAWIALLYSTEEGTTHTLVATCVLRMRSMSAHSFEWILETLVASPTQKGYGNNLVRSVMSWLYDRCGPFVLHYVWEVTLTQLMRVWWRGWLRSAVAIHRGWSWREKNTCTMCPSAQSPTFVLPTLFDTPTGSAVLSDSGLQDGWGYILALYGAPSWDSIAKKGGWHSLWYHGVSPPSAKWKWTGEWVVLGCLNAPSPTHIPWITAEISTPVIRNT